MVIAGRYSCRRPLCPVVAGGGIGRYMVKYGAMRMALSKWLEKVGYSRVRRC